jgi:hypothetical protein
MDMGALRQAMEEAVPWQKTCVLLIVQQIMAFLMHRVEMAAEGIHSIVYASISIVGINEIS